MGTLSHVVPPFVVRDSVKRYIARWVDNHPFLEACVELPEAAFSNFSFEQMCHLRFMTRSWFGNRDMETMFKEPCFTIVDKIKNSMWRWGMNDCGWAELVDAHCAITQFDIGLPDFTVTLDYTTGYNECGRTVHSRIFCDGVFAFLIHYRGKHVMTVGFSIMSDHRVLIQQIQSVAERSNRWLYRFPENRVEFILDRFKDAFPMHALYIIDGTDNVNKSLTSYHQGKNATLRKIANNQHIKTEFDRKWLADQEEWAAILSYKISKLERDLDRIAKFYANTGKYLRGETLIVNNLCHYQID